MKAALCLFVASFAWADEAADRAAIERAIAALNELPPRIAAVAESPVAAHELTALMNMASSPSPARPTVVISHEPWGEATIDFRAVDLPNRIVSRTIRFITPNVALVDADRTREDGTFQDKPLLFVLKKVEDDWKIASARVLAPH